MRNEYVIAHLSDIHVGEAGFKEGKVLECIGEVNNLSANLIVVTGDLTWGGLPEEFKEAKELLKRLEPEPLVIMGNHDARNVGYKTFEKYFGERMVSYEDDKVFLIGVDSTSPDVDEGHIGRVFLKNIHESIVAASEDKVKIFTLHHHLVPIPNAGRERNILIDAGDTLKMLIENGVELVLSGHRHVSWTWEIENTVIVHAGTVGSPRIRGMASQNYSIIRIDDKSISVSLKLIGEPERKARRIKRLSLN
jgi:3',5'-cyclic AMP phosphodiesterase CpdA